MAVFAAARRRWTPWIALILGVVMLQTFGTRTFPAVWDTVISDPLETLARWAQSNRRQHPLFTLFFVPLTSGLNAALRLVEDVLDATPWFSLPLGLGLLVWWRTHDPRRALVTLLIMTYPGVVGLWDQTMSTLALMAVAVAFCVLIGLPLGVLAAFRPRFEALIRPALDAMQTIPAPIYFLPVLLFFGIGPVAGAFATVIYALPPLIRLTSLGISQVPAASVEASSTFGASSRQTLLKVQLPMALNTIMTGIGQTINMALGIVVLAALMAAGGLGQAILEALRQRATGRGLAAGLAIVAVGLALDRAARAMAQTDRVLWLPRRTSLPALAALVIATVVAAGLGIRSFPRLLSVQLFDPVDNLVVWVRDNLRWLTRSVNDFLVADVYIPTRNFLSNAVAWQVLVFVAGWLGWMLKGWRLSAFVMISIMMMGLLGWWTESVDTLIQVAAAVLLSLLIGLPVGIWAGTSRRVETVLAPFLDALQTLPPFVYMIPVVNWFTVGVVPGVIASVLYAMVPGVRISALGISQVPSDSLEASRTFGATPRQTMTGVRIPLALPTIMTAVNQVIMMVLAMVIIAGLIGGGALGFEVINAVTRGEVGNGFEVGLCIALMAMVLDRLTQAASRRLQPPSDPA